MENVTPFRPKPFDAPKKNVMLMCDVMRAKIVEPKRDLNAALAAVERINRYNEPAQISNASYTLNACGMLIAALTQINQVAVTLALINENDLAADIDCFQQCGRVIADQIMQSLSVQQPAPPDPPRAA